MEENGQITRPWHRWFQIIQALTFKHFVVAPTLDPASVSANTTSEQTFTVNGLTTDMVISITKSSHTAGLVIGSARVSAADTVAITFGNLTGSSINPPSEEYKIMGTRE